MKVNTSTKFDTHFNRSISFHTFGNLVCIVFWVSMLFDRYVFICFTIFFMFLLCNWYVLQSLNKMIMLITYFFVSQLKKHVPNPNCKSTRTTTLPSHIERNIKAHISISIMVFESISDRKAVFGLYTCICLSLYHESNFRGIFLLFAHQFLIFFATAHHNFYNVAWATFLC